MNIYLYEYSIKVKSVTHFFWKKIKNNTIQWAPVPHALKIEKLDPFNLNAVLNTALTIDPMDQVITKGSTLFFHLFFPKFTALTVSVISRINVPPHSKIPTTLRKCISKEGRESKNK